MKEPIWLQKNAVIAFHEMLLVEHGGVSGMRDEGLLDSALGRPLNQYFYDKANLYELAAAYAFGIARNHPFVDGNKRTAFVSMKTFLMRNDRQLSPPKSEAIEIFFALAAGEVGEAELVRWIENSG
ncbi:MAG TPA: type II toxin-antitoxin system death-on-curing family toxin [Myxococcota bacterium]|nr:type II toxin-antitoxin system death-on-curing family toxin [Myxococcota bacterium]